MSNYYLQTKRELARLGFTDSVPMEADSHLLARVALTHSTIVDSFFKNVGGRLDLSPRERTKAAIEALRCAQIVDTCMRLSEAERERGH